MEVPLIALISLISVAFAIPTPVEQEMTCQGDVLVLRLVFDDDTAKRLGDGSSFDGWIGNTAGAELVTFWRTARDTLETKVSPAYYADQQLGYTVDGLDLSGVVALDQSTVRPENCPSPN